MPFTALQNVLLGMRFSDTIPHKEWKPRATELLERVGLGNRIHSRPGTMSVGERQRVAIARALANRPMIVLADEPTGNLDLHTGEQIIEILAGLTREHGVTVISATHDHKMLSTSDRVVWISEGSIARIENREDLDIEVGSIDGSSTF